MAYHPRPDDGLTATQRYHNKCDAITIRPRKEEGEKIRSAASAMGYDSLTRFIIDAIAYFVAAHTEDVNK